MLVKNTTFKTFLYSFPRVKYIFLLLLFNVVNGNEYLRVYDSKTNSERVNESIICEDGVEKIVNPFSVPDYLVLGSMLVISCGIGLFYGFLGDKPESSSDFLLGGSSMGTFPMAMSLAASFVTAVELLGNPAEMYSHGSQFWIICLAFIVVIPITSKFYLPVFMSLRLTSSYEYFALRFNSKTRYLASGLYILQMVLYTSVAVYAPALALSNVTGLNVYLAVTVVYVVCIFYASQGGMKAVIIADTFQAGVLIGSILLILVLGEKFVGGTGVVWSENYRTGRLELFNMDPSLTVRHTFWSVVVGGIFYWMTMFCSNQASIQKYLSVENISQVRKALWTSCFGLILIYTINFYTGMIMVAHYKDCDPQTAGQISGSDEILPLYVISNLGHFKGITGFFVAGIFAASLGTVASALNSLAAVTMQDFVEGALRIHLDDAKGAIWAKTISVIYGAISFALVFIVAQLGSVMQVAISFNGMVGGVTLGLFTLGMFFPWANSKGALFGSILAVALITLMCVGQQISIASGNLVEVSKPISIEICPCLNETEFEQSAFLLKQNAEIKEDIFFLYRISYIWYSALGFLITVIMGMVGSFATGAQRPEQVHADLLTPIVRNFFKTNNSAVMSIPLKVASEGEKEKGAYNAIIQISNDCKESECQEKLRKISAP